MDVPQEQLRTIILPPDPPPILNARPPNFAYEEAGPVQSTLTATVPMGGTNLPVVSVAGFVVGQVVWVQLVDARYSANISFGQYQITGIDAVNNILSISDLLVAAGLAAKAPINGCVTVASTVIPAPANVHFVSVVMSGSGGAGEQHQGTVWFATVAFSGTGG